MSVYNPVLLICMQGQRAVHKPGAHPTLVPPPFSHKGWRQLEMATRQRGSLLTPSGHLLLPSPKLTPLSRAPLRNPAHKHSFKAGRYHSCLCPLFSKGRYPICASYPCKNMCRVLRMALPWSLGRGKPTNLQLKLQIHPKLKTFNKTTHSDN